MEPEVHTINHIVPIAELPIEPFKWESFSYFDTLKYTIQKFLNFVFCQFLNNHDWIIQVTDWNFDKVDTVEKFRLHCARNLKCSCCEKIVDIDDADLNWRQQIWYSHYTSNYFKYQY